MKTIHELVETFLDDRDALSSQEMSRLAQEVDRSPPLAEAVKDQLVLRELVSQMLAEDRRNFPAQAAQRRRDFERGEEELFRQVLEVRSLAAEELKARAARGRPFHRLTFWSSLAMVLMLAVGAGVSWEQWTPPPTVARVVALEGDVSLERKEQWLAAARASEIKTGDRILVGQDATATLRYPDGTTLLVDSESLVQLLGRPRDAKHVHLLRGGLSADVAPQPAGEPLAVETQSALVRVLGTKFFVYATEEGTRVGVTQGRIALVRRNTGDEKFVAAGESGLASRDVLQVWKGVWPSNPTGAALVFESEPKLKSGVGLIGGPQPISLIARGRARLSQHGALVLDDGAYAAEGARDMVFDACVRTDELTVEAIVHPNDGEQTDAAILHFGGEELGRPNFALTQSDGRFWFFLTSERRGHWFEAGEATAEAPRHIVITCRSGRLAGYVDGELRFAREDLISDFSAWRRGELIFGDRPGGGHDWRGIVEGAAVYNRALCKNEIQRNAAAYAEILDRRRPISASDAPLQTP